MSIDEFIDTWLRTHIKPAPGSPEHVSEKAGEMYRMLVADAAENGWSEDEIGEAFEDLQGYVRERIEAANASLRRVKS